MEPKHLVPSTAVNDNDHGALVRVAAGICIPVMLCFLGMRVLLRWPWNALFGKDDVVIVIASGFAVIQAIVALVAVSEGLGKRAHLVSQSSTIASEKLIYSSDLLFIITIFTGKLAIALLFYRLAAERAHSRFAYGLGVASIAFGAIAFIMIAVPQTGFTPWSYGPSTADSMAGRWIAVSVMSLALEALFLVFPVWLVWDLQMRRSTKALVIFGMWTRLPLIPIAILRLLSLLHSLHSSSFLFSYATTETWTQGEIAYTLISATIPSLRIFLYSANTGLLPGDLTGKTTTDATITYGRASKASGPRSRRMKRTRSNARVQESVKLSDLGRGENVTQAEPSDSISMASDSSQRIIVRQTVDVEYSLAESHQHGYQGEHWPIPSSQQ